jgi:ankyrin repeat protein
VIGGWTPLMIAMLYGRPDVVEALLAGGADVNDRSPK